MSKTFDYKGKLVNDPVDHELGRLPIGRLLFKMSVPMVISMFMLALYNVVDSIFISRVSEDALSALSLAYPVQFLMVAINIVEQNTATGMNFIIILIITLKSSFRASKSDFNISEYFPISPTLIPQRTAIKIN